MNKRPHKWQYWETRKSPFDPLQSTFKFSFWLRIEVFDEKFFFFYEVGHRFLTEIRSGKLKSHRWVFRRTRKLCLCSNSVPHSRSNFRKRSWILILHWYEWIPPVFLLGFLNKFDVVCLYESWLFLICLWYSIICEFHCKFLVIFFVPSKTVPNMLFFFQASTIFLFLLLSVCTY